MSITTINIIHNHDLLISTTFPTEQLSKSVLQDFLLQAYQLNTFQFQTSYIDEDGDQITVETDDDYEVAKLTHQNKELKLEVKVTDEHWGKLQQNKEAKIQENDEVKLSQNTEVKLQDVPQQKNESLNNKKHLSSSFSQEERDEIIHQSNPVAQKDRRFNEEDRIDQAQTIKQTQLSEINEKVNPEPLQILSKLIEPQSIINNCEKIENEYQQLPIQSQPLLLNPSSNVQVEELEQSNILKPKATKTIVLMKKTQTQSSDDSLISSSEYDQQEKIAGIEEQIKQSLLEHEKNIELEQRPEIESQILQKVQEKPKKKEKKDKSISKKQQKKKKSQLTEKDVKKLIKQQLLRLLPDLLDEKLQNFQKPIGSEIIGEKSTFEEIQASPNICCYCSNSLKIPFFINSQLKLRLCAQCQPSDISTDSLIKVRNPQMLQKIVWAQPVEVCVDEIAKAKENVKSKYFTEIKKIALSKIKEQFGEKVVEQKQEKIPKKKEIEKQSKELKQSSD